MEDWVDDEFVIMLGDVCWMINEVKKRDLHLEDTWSIANFTLATRRDKQQSVNSSN